MSTQLDLITIGRVSVDLYGQQIGSRLEDVSSFARAVGGCPANVAIGAARLGLKSALISRVGAEPMGRFVTEQLAREGVDARGVRVDEQRLTALVLLSVRDAHTFPLIFYRDNCADSALSEADIEADFIGAARAVLVTGTHFAMAAAARAQHKAIDIARAHRRKVLLDIDYRPNLWGIGGHDAGESRYARSARVTEALASVLPACDLIVGTEEELHVAAGSEDTLEALRAIRRLSAAVLVCKRGAQGCLVFAGDIPGALEQGLVARGMDVEVYNVLGAGDAFLAGFLYGYLRDAPHEQSARFGNACGAIAVSRLLCSAEFPTLPELTHYLAHGSAYRALRHDAQLNHLHWATTRSRAPESLLALAIDEPGTLADAAVEQPERLARLTRMAIDAAARVGAGHEGVGVLLDAPAGDALLQYVESRTLWRARAVQRPGVHPLDTQADSLAAQLIEWPAGLTVTCRYQADDRPEMRRAQARTLLRIAAACRAQHHELLLDIRTATQVAGENTTARALSHIYELNVRPDWWLLEAQPDSAAWALCAHVIARHDEYCRGMLVRLGSEPAAALAALSCAAQCPTVRGFVLGGTMPPAAAQQWLAGQLSDAAVVADIAGRFGTLMAAWHSARESRPARPERSAT